jgi:hypothetical protein
MARRLPHTSGTCAWGITVMPHVNQEYESWQHQQGAVCTECTLVSGCAAARSLHLEPNKVLVDTIIRLGQRAVVGKVRRYTLKCGLQLQVQMTRFRW